MKPKQANTRDGAPVRNLFINAAGVYLARVKKNGKSIKRNLATTDMRTAIARLKTFRRELDADRTALLENSRQRSGSCRLSAVLDLFLKSSRVEVLPSTRLASARGLVGVLNIGLGLGLKTVKGSKAQAEANLTDVGKLSSDVLSWQLADAFKKAHLGDAGKLNAGELDTRKRGANSTLKQARSIFQKSFLHPERGLYAELRLPPTLDGFLREELFRVNQPVYTVPEPETLQRVWDGLPALRESEPELYKAVMLALGTGLRLGEIGNLQWPALRVMGRREVVVVAAHEQWRGTKAKTDRIVPMPDGLLPDLLQLKTDPVQVIAGSANFRNKGLSRGIGTWMKSRGWRRRLKIHELRKWFGAELATATGDLYAVTKLLGHADYQTTQKTYEALTHLPENVVQLPQARTAATDAKIIHAAS